MRTNPSDARWLSRRQMRLQRGLRHSTNRRSLTRSGWSTSPACLPTQKSGQNGVHSLLRYSVLARRRGSIDGTWLSQTRRCGNASRPLRWPSRKSVDHNRSGVKCCSARKPLDHSGIGTGVEVDGCQDGVYKCAEASSARPHDRTPFDRWLVEASIAAALAKPARRSWAAVGAGRDRRPTGRLRRQQR
jgi:hypothetical protein